MLSSGGEHERKGDIVRGFSTVLFVLLISSFLSPTTSLPEEIDVRLEVYDILGRRVRLLLNERQSAGQHSIICNSSAFASGIYFYQLTAEGRPLVGRMTSLK